MTEREQPTVSVERMADAIRSACNAEAMDHDCDYPNCKCRLFPAAIRAGVDTWERLRPNDGEQR